MGFTVTFSYSWILIIFMPPPLLLTLLTITPCLLSCLSVCARICMCVHSAPVTTVHTWRSEGNLMCESSPSTGLYSFFCCFHWHAGP